MPINPFVPACGDEAGRQLAQPGALDRRAWCAGVMAAGLGLAGCAQTPRSAAPVAGAGRHQVPLFSSAKAGEWPEGWAPYVLRRDKRQTTYQTVSVYGRTVVHAEAESASSGLRCAVDIDPLATPWLSWQWRANAVPPKARVDDDELDDTPARVIVAFDGDTSSLPLRERLFFEQVELFTGHRLPFATLMYVWDAQLPVGQVVAYSRSQRIQYQVVESGAAHAGHWLNYERNVAQDYRQVFGQEPGRIVAVGVLTDSDDLKHTQEAWFGDLSFSALQRESRQR